MKSYLGQGWLTERQRRLEIASEPHGIAVLAERLRRTLKARVRKSVGSIPTDCN